MRRHLLVSALALSGGALAIGAADFASAAPPKTTVCHLGSDGTYKTLNVGSQAAVSAHLRHDGDGLPGGAVPGRPGFAFGVGCTPIAADTDGDGVVDSADNCPTVANTDQSDRYRTVAGDACEDSDQNGVADIAEANICIHVNGNLILNNGTSICSSTLTTGTRWNIAIATGDYATATTYGGDGNSATATGSYAEASAGFGDGNTATATGRFAVASAAVGDGNTATATGDYARATAAEGDGNTATTTGDDAGTNAGNGDGNTATATGSFAEAGAVDGDGNTATATGACTVAVIGVSNVSDSCTFP